MPNCPMVKVLPLLWHRSGMEDKFGASMIRELLMKATPIWNELVITGRRRQVCHGDGSVPAGNGHRI